MTENLKVSPQELERELIWRRCQEDKLYFFENFWYIPVVGVGAKLFSLYPYQRELVKFFDTNVLTIALKARQIGYTTIAAAYAFHDAYFNENRPWLLVSRTEDAASKILDRIYYGYHRLPKWMKERRGAPSTSTQQILAWSEHGGRIESVPATGSTGRGDSVYGALLDEVAYMEEAEAIWGAVEPLVYGRAMLFSTANGMGNFFHDIWLDSQRDDSVWEGVFYPWYVRDGRDEDWYEHQRLSYRGREWLFFQEYPSTPEEAFAKSGRVAFGSETLAQHDIRPPERRYEYIIGQGFFDLEEGGDADIILNVWREPEVRRDESGMVIQPPNYVIGCDVAEGLEHGDASAISIFDANTGEQVASVRCFIPVQYLGQFLFELGKRYHYALIVPERNNAGILPIEDLRRAGYPRIYRSPAFAQRGVDRSEKFGWITNRKSKPKMILDFARALEIGEVTLHDPEFVHEAQTFVADGKGGYEATAGNHDDVVIAALVGWQGYLDSPRYPIVWKDHGPTPVTFDDLTKIGFNFDEPKGLDRPIGRRFHKEERVSRKSFILQPGNLK